jgi:TRAP-type C4-dicarboxylate transport system permease small subunit
MSGLDASLAAAAAAAPDRERSPLGLRPGLREEEGTRMRRLLDGLYDASAWLAALAMIGVLVMVMLSIVSRQFGFHVPGTDAYAGYSMAAAGFLALAHTLKKNEHIRVTLILARLHGKARHAMEMWAISAGVVLGGLFAFYSVRLAWVSHEIHDISTSNDATPLWIPQVAMAVGSVILLIALLDEWVLELRGQRKTVESEEALHNE